ncbi:MAG: L-lactate permease [Candidatus Micrarchaeota archaeon]|nr:L-lactate permease [Candidatus Micrarchaeota archaeon]
MVSWLFIFSIFPLLIIFISIFLFRQSIIKSLLIACIVTFFLNVYVWKSDEAIVNNILDVRFNLIENGPFSSHYGRAITFAFFDSISTVLIVFAGILIFKIIYENNIIEFYKKIFEKFSQDYVHISIFFCFFLANLLESISGYATAQALIAPILFSFGLPVTIAASVSLIGTLPTYFLNSFNNPSILGFNFLKLNGLGSIEYLNTIKSSIILAHVYSSVSNLFLLFCITALIIIGLKKNLKLLLAYAPFLLTVWTLFELSFISTFWFFANDIKSLMVAPLIASIVSIIWYAFILKTKLFKTTIKFEESLNHNKKDSRNDEQLEKKKFMLPIILYAIIVFVLIFTTDTSVKHVFSIFNINLEFNIKRFLIDDYITTTYVESYNVFDHPGIFLLLTVFGFNLILPKFKYNSISIDVLLIKRILELFVIIFLAHLFTYLMLISSHNSYSIPGMFVIIADELSLFFAEHYELLNIYIGLLFGFITGSSTIANIILTPTNFEISNVLELTVYQLLGLQLIGSALGVGLSIIHTTVCVNAALHHHYDYDEHINSKKTQEIIKRVWKITIPVVITYSIACIIVFLIIST